MNCSMTRRRTLQLALGALAAQPVAGRAVNPAPTVASRVIDTHTHFYDPTRPQGVPWPPENSPLYRPVYPKDWLAVSAKHGVHETVVVEASKLVEDNDWILDLAASEKSIVGFVGNLQPSDAAFADHLKRLAANPLYRGIRVSGAALLDHIEKPEFLSGLKLLASLNLSLDVNGLRSLLPIATLAKTIPDLRIMIDHCGGCGDPQKLKPEWKSGIAEAAAQANVYCKVSALVEMTGSAVGKAPAETAYYLPVLDHLWEVFGQRRLVFGSNWPVSDRGASYDVLFKIVSDYFTTKGREACEDYFWKNSAVVYQWLERK
jgi:L-fuconolactonase